MTLSLSASCDISASAPSSSAKIEATEEELLETAQCGGQTLEMDRTPLGTFLLFAPFSLQAEVILDARLLGPESLPRAA